MRSSIFFILMFISGLCAAQDSLTIDFCIDAAVEHHPRKTDRQIYEQWSNINIDNIKANWYPSLDLNGQLSYQSDVVELDMEIPNLNIDFPGAPKDQYKLYLDMKQTLFDGGRTKVQKDIEMISAENNVTQLESEIDKVKSRIIEYYYNILNLQETKKILNFSMEILSENEKDIKAGIDNGLFMLSDLYMVQLEIIKLEQEIQNVDLNKKTLIELLGQRCGFEITDSAEFILSNYELIKSNSQRKELEVFELQKKLLNMNSEAIARSRYPVVFAFGQMGYGNPGLNMLQDEFDTYYYVGAGFKWNIWDWNTVKRKRESIVLQSELINNRKSEFESEMNMMLENQSSIIGTHLANLSKLEEIESLRSKMFKIHQSQFEDGVLRLTDYIESSNQLKISRINLNNERIKLQKAIVNYLYLNGEL